MAWAESKSSCPYFISYIHKINENEFIGVPRQIHKNRKPDGIYKFDILNEKWTKIIQYNPTFIESFNPSSSVYNYSSKTLYISSDHYTDELPCAIFDLNNTNIEPKISSFTGLRFVSVTNENKIHLISTNKQYRKSYYICTADLDVVKELDLMKGIYDTKFYEYFLRFGSIYLPKKKMIYIFGGYNAYYHGWQNVVYIHNCESNDSKWIKIAMPRGIYGMGTVCTHNEQFIILLGGHVNYKTTYQPNETIYRPQIQPIDTIYIFDTKTNQFKTSNIKCPMAGTFDTTIMMSKSCTTNEKLVHGFVHNDKSLNNKICLKHKFPQYLRDLVQSFYCNEWIYAIGADGRKQWMINSDKILSNKDDKQ